MHGCQSYRVKRIKTYFREEEKLLQKKVWGTVLLPQIVIPLIKPISSSISLIDQNKLKLQV